MVNAARVIGKSPIHSLKEVLALSSSDITELLKIVKKNGVGISVVSGIDDRVFPMDRMQKAIELDMINGFYSTKGTHNEFVLRPARYSKLVDKALDDLEKRGAGNK